jgi:N12 class adenine-specific DNA methylase
VTDRRGAPRLTDLLSGRKSGAPSLFDLLDEPAPVADTFGNPISGREAPPLLQPNPIVERINAAPRDPGAGASVLQRHNYELEKNQYELESKGVARDADTRTADAAKEDAGDTYAEEGRKFLNRIIPSAKQFAGGMMQALVEGGGDLPANLPLTDQERLDAAAEFNASIDLMRKRGEVPGQKMAESAARDLAANEYNPGDSLVKKYVPMIAEGVLQMIPSIAVAVTTKNPTLGAAAMMPQVYGQQYAESRDQGRSPDEARLDSVFMSAAEALGEEIPLGMMMKPGGKFLASTLKTAGAEGVQEMFTQVLQTGYEKGVLNPDMTWGEAFQSVIDAGIVGFGVGGAMHAVTAPARHKPAGVIENVDLAPAPITADDVASPLPTELIAQGRKTVAGIDAKGAADQILADNQAPQVGTRVVVSIGGKDMVGTVRDAFVDHSDAELGPQAGVAIDLDSGGKLKEFFGDLRDAGAEIRRVEDVLHAPPPVTLAPEIAEKPASVTRETLPVPPARGAAIPSNDELKATFRAQESSGNDNAKNPRSSATGRYQFTKGTWEGLGGDWENRTDPAEQERLMSKLLDRNRTQLEHAGITPDAGNMYAAHVFGAGGAVEMAHNPNAPVAADVQKANPHLQGMTNGQALAWARGAAGDTASTSSGPAPVEMVQTPNLADEALSTKQVDTPALETPAVQPSDSIVKLPEPAAAPEATIADTPSGKGIAVSGLTEEMKVAIARDVPKASAVPNKDGALVFSKKWEPQIREALNTLPKTLPNTVGTEPVGDGTRAAPVRVESAEHMDVAAAQVAEPTEAQKEAGNYRKGHVNVQGLDITIETPKGATRSGTDPDGKPWSVEMPAHYGYVKRTVGADAENIDVYVGPKPDSAKVYVVDQVDADTRKFDEHKAMLGYSSRQEAENAYRAAFSDGRGAERSSAMTEMTVEQFKSWLSTEQTAPAADQAETIPWNERIGALDDKIKAERAAPTNQDDGYRAVLESIAAGDRASLGETEKMWAARSGYVDDRGRLSAAGAKALQRFRADSIQISDTLPGGMPVERAAVAARARVDQDATAQQQTRLKQQGAKDDGWPTADPIRNLSRDDGRFAVRGGTVLTSVSGRQMSPAPKWNDSTPATRTRSLAEQEKWLREEAIAEVQARSGKGDNDLAFPNSYMMSLRSMRPGNMSQSDHGTINDVLFGDYNGPKEAASWQTDQPPAKPARAAKPAPSKPITVYHGGPGIEGDIRAPFFVSDDKKFAQSYADDRGRGRGRVDSFTFTPRKTATMQDIDAAARRAGVPAKQLEQMTGGMLLDPEFNDQAPAVAAELRKQGFDSATFNDFAADSEHEQPTFAVLDPSVIKPEEATQRPESLTKAPASAPATKEGQMAVLRAMKDRGEPNGAISVAADKLPLVMEGDLRSLFDDAPSKPPSNYGASNKLVTVDRADELRRKLRAKMNQLNTGIDPEALAMFTELGVFHIEAGARRFADFARAVVDDLGISFTRARPFLRSAYNGARDMIEDHGLSVEGMDTPEQVRAALATLTQEEGNGLQGTVPSRDAGASAGDVQRAPQERGAGRARDGEEQGSSRDVRATGDQGAEAAQRGSEGRDAAAGDRGTGARDADRVPADQSANGRGRRADTAAVTGQNWRIEPGALDEARGAAQKARDNLGAIAIVKTLDRTGEPATREQQERLAKYVGWGGLKNAFNETDGTFPKGFERIGPELKQLLTTEEYDTARRSIQYAHYTSEKIIRPMWDAALKMGFKGGQVFEPGMGTGNFLGMMPAEVAAATTYQGVEFDGVTARIAQLLYPQSGIRHGDFTEGHLPKNAFDLVIGNPPFSQTVVRSDPEYGKLGFVLHDFFFAKSLDAVKPGGLLMFVTSAGTMNKVGADARAWLAERADLVGGVRLPGGAFKENAGTDVTTDILVLRKRMAGEAPGDRSWTETVEATLPDRDGGTVKEQVSRYFRDNPEQVLGIEESGDKLTATARYSVRARDGQNLTAELNAALERIASKAQIVDRATESAGAVDMMSTERKEGSFYLGADGRLMQHRGGAGSPVEGRGKGVKGGFSAAEQERIRALVPIRDALRTVLGHDMAGRNAEADAARKDLNGVYDRFIQQFGPINKAEIRYQRPSVIQQESARAQAREETRLAGGFFSEGSFVADDPNAKLAELAAARRDARETAAALGREWDEGDFDPADMPDIVVVKRPNIDPFMDDQEGYRLRSIEHYNDDTGEAKKGAIFYENVVTKERVPEINSANDALLFVLNRRGRPEIGEIADMAGISRSEALEALGDTVFRVPEEGETYQTREQYLSGNVRQKLELARAAAARDPDLRRNVTALEAVQPTPLGPADISANLGMPWIPADVVSEFAVALGLKGATVTYRRKLAQWAVAGDRYSAAARSEWGTSRRDGLSLLADALNRQDPKVYDSVTDAQGKRIEVLNAVDTQAAQDKVREIRAKFSEWVWSEPARSDKLTSLYNETYNNLVAPTYDGAYLTTPGIAANWSWRPHQKRVVARIIQAGNTYMAHAVGAGKTSAMIGAGMEMRRLGLVRKPMYAVPNHMLGQFTKEFYEQYPTAKIMVADERQFHTDRRKQFVANLGTEDLDAVIITHSAFGFIPISEDFSNALLGQQIADYREILTELKAEKSGDPGQRITQRRIEQQIESLEQKLKGRKKRSDQVFTFEETGVDFLFVDEAHLFRKLDFATRMGNVRGVDSNGSAMAYDLFSKTRYLETRTPGRSHVLASGTPVTNTMAELYSLSRYLQENELDTRGLAQFDAWAGAFGETVTALEQDPAGGYKPQTRFAKFVNVPELSAMVRQVMDVVTSRELEQYVVRPKLKGGKRQMRLTQASPTLEAYQQTLAARMKAIESRKGKPKKGDDILLSVIGDGRKAAIDMRLVDPTLREEDASKLEDLIQNVARIAGETKNQPFHKAEGDGYSAKPAMHGPATQMVFSDLGINGDFPIHRYIKAELMKRAKLKDSEVAIISDFKNHIAKQRLFNDMNEGKVRVLIGSVPKMGTGVNAQRRLYAVHNLDPQWYPANDEQRNGRALRQGNMNPEIEIIDYSTKGTYDSTMWGLMETKARFIEGFFNGDPTMRSMEDLGEASQYEQAKALTTADPRILEMTQFRQDLERAMLRRSAFEREIYNVRERIRSAEDWIERTRNLIPHIEADLAQRVDLSGDKFTAKVGSETFTDRTEFGEAILARVDALIEGGLSLRDRKIGELSGFDLTADVSIMSGGGNSASLYLNRNGNRQERVKMASPAGIPQSAAAILTGFEGDLEEARDSIARNEKLIEDFTPQTQKRFEGMAEIDELQSKVDAIESELTKEAAARAAAPGTAPAPEQASRLQGEAVDWADVQSALRKEMVASGIADRATLEAGFNLFADPRQVGAFSGNRIRVALEAADPVFTLRHEIIHALRGLGLFSRDEWGSLSRYVTGNREIMDEIEQEYPDLDTESQVEEGIAHAYSLWRQGNDVPKGFVQRALTRLHDFIGSLYRAVTGRGPAYSQIFEDVASGRIGSRSVGKSLPNTVERLSVLGSIDPEAETVSEIMARSDTLRDKLADGYENWRIAMQDRMLPVLRAEEAATRALGRELTDEERPYMAEELMSGRVGAKIDRLSDDLIEPLFASMKAEGITADEIESYLYARHAPERNAHIASVNPEFEEGTGSGMTDIEAAAIMRRIENSGRMKEFERVAERVDALVEFSRQEKLEAGLLSEEQVEAWASAYDHYVPLRGFAELENADERPNTGGQGLTVRGPESKRAFGRRSKADDILAHVIMQAEEAIVRGEKNRVATALYDLAKAAPDPDFWQTNKTTMKRRMNRETGLVETYPVHQLVAEDAPWTVSLKIEGKERRVTLNKSNPAARKLAEAMRRLNEQQTNFIVGMLSKMNRWLSAANTSLNPDFVVTNAVRDLQTALVNAAGLDIKGLQKGIARDYRKAMFAATKGAFGKESGDWGKWWREFNDAGGRVSYNQMQDLATLQKDIVRRFDPKRRPNPTGMNVAPKQLAMIAFGDIKALYGFIDKVNTGVENAVRLAAFKNAVELGATREQAASLAKNLTVNFNRRGSHGVYMNALYLFYNASMQGSARLLMALKHKNVRRIVYGVIAAGALQELINAAISGADDDDELVYDKIPEFEKSRNMIFMIPGPWGDYLKLPMPWGYNAFHTLGRNMVRGLRGQDIGRVMGDTATAFIDAFNPIGGTNSVLNLVAPTLLDPVVDLERNRDFADRPIMPDQNQFGPQTPDNQRYWGNVGPQWKAVTDALNTASGGDDVVAGAIDMSPETLEYLFGVVTGGAGAFIDRTGGAILKVADGDPETVLNVGDIPIVRRLAGKKPDWYDKAAFYERLGQVEQVVDNAKTYRDRGDAEGMARYVESNKDLVELRGAAKEARKVMREVRSARNAAKLGKDTGRLDAEQYSANMAAVKTAEEGVISAFNARYIGVIKQPLRP